MIIRLDQITRLNRKFIYKLIGDGGGDLQFLKWVHGQVDWKQGKLPGKTKLGLIEKNEEGVLVEIKDVGIPTVQFLQWIQGLPVKDPHSECLEIIREWSLKKPKKRKQGTEFKETHPQEYKLLKYLEYTPTQIRSFEKLLLK